MDIDFEIDPFTYIGSTIGNAVHSGLSLDDVYNALLVAEHAREFDSLINARIFEVFDGAITSTINLHEIVQEHP
jgi:uncharacterized protein YciU (UPF0263 family)